MCFFYWRLENIGKLLFEKILKIIKKNNKFDYLNN